MLSRVADALFWMGRYLERASFLSRAVDVTFHLDLDLHGVLVDPLDSEWARLLEMGQQPCPAADAAEGAIPRWILVEPANASRSTKRRRSSTRHDVRTRGSSTRK